MKTPEVVDVATLMAAVLGPTGLAIGKALGRLQPDAVCRPDYLREVWAYATLVFHLIHAAIAHAAAAGGAAALVVRIVCMGFGLQWQ